MPGRSLNRRELCQVPFVPKARGPPRDVLRPLLWAKFAPKAGVGPCRLLSARTLVSVVAVKASGIGLMPALLDESRAALVPEDHAFVGIGVARTRGRNGLREYQATPVGELQVGPLRRARDKHCADRLAAIAYECCLDALRPGAAAGRPDRAQ